MVERLRQPSWTARARTRRQFFQSATRIYERPRKKQPNTSTIYKSVETRTRPHCRSAERQNQELRRPGAGDQISYNAVQLHLQSLATVFAKPKLRGESRTSSANDTMLIGSTGLTLHSCFVIKREFSRSVFSPGVVEPVPEVERVRLKKEDPGYVISLRSGKKTPITVRAGSDRITISRSPRRGLTRLAIDGAQHSHDEVRSENHTHKRAPDAGAKAQQERMMAPEARTTLTR
ncbi:unnamed protein product [Trichogramma brassicae]|uniref:Uncharacterized protein n=1 Tax=Trichogramma brassicae TaxID=86971 RepID=A0A6H5IT17_9HYME|nr:unnamed protein product [Trichogramma brassicae]